MKKIEMTEEEGGILKSLIGKSSGPHKTDPRIITKIKQDIEDFPKRSIVMHAANHPVSATTVQKIKAGVLK